MRAVRTKLVRRKIVTRAKCPEDTKLFLAVDEPAPHVALDTEDEAAISRALASTRSGKAISLPKFRTILNRL